MAKGMYHYLQQVWKKPDKELFRDRLIEWRRSNAIVKVDRPLRLDRARALGYKAKKGIIVVRVRIGRGGRKRKTTGVRGRKSTKTTTKKVLKMNYRWVAEIRAERKYKNLEVLNSYWIGKDGKHYFFEIIMVDPTKPEIKNDPVYKWIVKSRNKKRAERGLTSAAKKSRGLRSKSPTLKVRPSLNAWAGRGK